jgi:murein DD-endopeptidase MepM/ murein hydrolase activator NlpD
MVAPMSRNDHGKKFGEIAPVLRNRLSFSTILKIFSAGFCVVICLFVVLAALKQGVEKTPPTIHLMKHIDSIGIKNFELPFTAEDAGTGLKSVSVMLRNGPVSEKLATQELAREKVFNSNIAVDSEKLPFEDGPAELVMEVVDDTVWNNKSLVVVPIIIDRIRPQLDLLYVSPRLEQLDTGIAFYRVRDSNLKSHGLQIGPHFFTGQPAGNLQAELGLPGVFATFFTVNKGEVAKVIAVDVANNVTEITLPVQVLERQPSQKVNLTLTSPEKLQTLKALFEREADPEIKVGETLNKDVLEGLSKGLDMGMQVVTALADIRVNRAASEVREIVERQPEPIKRWEGAPRLPALRIKYGFNDQLVVESHESQKSSRWEGRLDGVVFEANSTGLNVAAPLRGVVSYAGDLGVLGKAVILDHGFGIASIYHNLATTSVELGAVVEVGQALGTMGSTGLALGVQLGVMVVVQGVPVNPRPWLDAQEFQQTIQLSLEHARSKVLLQ